MATSDQSSNSATSTGGNTTGGNATGSATGSTLSPTGTARAADLGPALKQEGSKLADKSLASGVEVADAVGKAAQSAAQVLDESLPMLAGYVRSCAQHTERLADDLRNKKAEELLSSAVSWSREQPLVALAGAAMLGFALSRVAKAGLSESSTASGPALGNITDLTTGPASGGGHER